MNLHWRKCTTIHVYAYEGQFTIPFDNIEVLLRIYRECPVDAVIYWQKIRDNLE